MLIGAHVSIAGGFDKSIDRAVKLGANCLQTFASSPRSMKFNKFDDEIVEKYKAKKTDSEMGPHFFHGVYLINLATEKPDFLEVSVQSLVNYQQSAGRIGGKGTIFHLGSHKGAGFEQVREQVCGALEQALAATPEGVTLFLENAAGHKGTIGADLNELGWLIEHISSDDLRDKLGVCLDTQHAFASGYELRTKEGVAEFVTAADTAFGWERVGVMHANDSKTEFDSHRDRHENIGEGEIGAEGFRYVLQHPKIKGLPFLLEVPGEDRSGPRAEDVQKLRELAG